MRKRNGESLEISIVPPGAPRHRGPMNKKLNVGLWVVQGLLALVFLMSGGMKLTAPIATLIAQGMTWAEGREWLPRFIGASEVLGAIGLILPAATRIMPKLTGVAAAALALVMVLALGTHVAMGDLAHAPPSVVLGALAAFVAWGRLKAAPIPSRS